MSKYIIEGNINFYDELNKIDVDDNNDDTNLCLITGLSLTNDFVELNCGHKFNYEPLYYDILNHKTKLNFMEKKPLKSYELRCPYCRNIQNKLLPFYSKSNFKKVKGVNYYNCKRELFNLKCWRIGICDYETNKEIINDNDDKIIVVEKCNETKVINFDILKKSYCCLHKNDAINNFLKAEKENKKTEKENKKTEKENKKTEKENKKIEKENKKTETNKTIDVDSVLSCSHVLTKGKNKDSCCSGKIYKDNLCIRHYKKLI